MKPRTPGFWLIVATVGLLGMSGNEIFADKSPSAVKYFEGFKVIAEQGNSSAQYQLGRCYGLGRGVMENYEEAIKWFLKAAEKGHTQAQYTLGSCYENGQYGSGQSTGTNPAEALKWYRKAVEQGNADAESALGSCYTRGIGVPKNEIEGLKWFRKAGEQEQKDAQLYLGQFYLLGHGRPGEKDYVEAMKWYRKAAENGNPKAQSILGRAYFNGAGVEKDLIQAYAYLKLSEDREAFKAIEKKMAPESKLQGEQRADELVIKRNKYTNALREKAEVELRGLVEQIDANIDANVATKKAGK